MRRKIKPKQDWFEEVLTMEGRNQVISSLHIQLGASWESNNDWQKEGKLAAKVTEYVTMFRQVSEVHQSNSALLPSPLFLWGSSAKETVTPSAATGLKCWGDRAEATVAIHLWPAWLWKTTQPQPQSARDIPVSFPSVWTIRIACDSTNQIREMRSILPYHRKHGIEVLAFSTVESNFNEMLNNLHSFELIGFC